MKPSLRRRLRVAFGRTDADDLALSEGSSDPSDAESMAIDFVAYGEDCLLSGRVRLDADRLTDMLNHHDEYQLVDVLVQRLDGAGGAEVTEVIVPRDEVLLVHATGPRGSQSRRTRTRQHPVALQVGPYLVRGQLHAQPGSDPIASLRRRPVMVPLTDSSVEYRIDGTLHRRPTDTLLVNRERIDWVVPAPESEVVPPALPVPAKQGILLKDFTGAIVGDTLARTGV